MKHECQTARPMPTAFTAFSSAFPSSEITDQYAAYSKGRFCDARRHGGTPVFIPAKNEAVDIPYCLLSIANHKSHREGSYAVVVDNGSDDETTVIARRMGAVVLDVPFGRKMAATKEAFKFADENRLNELLFTDADTYIPRKWADTLTTRLDAINIGEGAAVFGNSLLAYNRLHVDLPSSAYKLARGVLSVVQNQVHARGHNYGVQLDFDGQIQAEIQQLPDEMFAGDDAAIEQALRRSGANIKPLTGLSSTVITKNDRVNSLFGRFSPAYSSQRELDYSAEYDNPS